MSRIPHRSYRDTNNDINQRDKAAVKRETLEMAVKVDSPEDLTSEKVEAFFAQTAQHNGNAYVVTTKRGDQFLCPTRGAAARTCRARGGISIAITRVRVPEYRWRPNSKAPWQDWLYM